MKKRVLALFVCISICISLVGCVDDLDPVSRYGYKDDSSSESSNAAASTVDEVSNQEGEAIVSADNNDINEFDEQSEQLEAYFEENPYDDISDVSQELPEMIDAIQERDEDTFLDIVVRLADACNGVINYDDEYGVPDVASKLHKYRVNEAKSMNTAITNFVKVYNSYSKAEREKYLDKATKNVKKATKWRKKSIKLEKNLKDKYDLD